MPRHPRPRARSRSCGRSRSSRRNTLTLRCVVRTTSQALALMKRDPVTSSLPLDNSADRPDPLVDVVIPVYNEERDLGPSVRRLHDYLATRFPFTAAITIADNASKDG